MATVRITFSKVNQKSGGDLIPVLSGSTALGLTELTTSGTAANVQSGGSDFTAPTDGGITVHTDGGAVWLSTRTTAAVGTDFYIADTNRLDIAISKGESISVIDDS
jgi:hypothetical protein